ncbi:efflux transporter periplasmic adaptor subunit [Pseudoxanthomonas yeongjuensis]|uniref:efflux RND transporter periplasmic adaptor subunit n=1 Tax=Pseudoxanthomonas yeongjuensis TaxID=377616 RepID=UPI001390827D|nr:efflux RND transporter periplasmic adaptor subunit [Pseudoxanthomonas yeongjuensis]KAF1715889.1 efflux transporter periplasmic adaptor subunit [Pseudoxanthomonas yeongjuensis]
MLIRSGARIALLAMFLPLLASCGKDKAATRTDEGSSKPVPVTTQVVQPSAWSDTLQAIGTAKARESVTLTSKVSEAVQAVHFESGDEVRAGTPLITLRGDSQQAALVAAQATYLEADRLYKRQNELADQQLIARSSLDTQRSVRDAALARVQQMRSDIGDRSVRAPFAGVLGIRQVSPGALITPTTVIATLDDISRIYVDFPVPEAQLANLAKGQALRARSNSYPGRDFEGVVSTIDARIDATTRAVTVRGDFPNPDRVLRPGMLMEVRLSRPERQALVVPEIALVQVGPDTFVYRVKADGSVERPKVEVGARVAGKAEVTDGIKAGDRIVVDGTSKLQAGSKVIDGAAQPPAPAANAPAAQG